MNHGYELRIQLGVILSLLAFIVLFKIDFEMESSADYDVVERTEIEMEDIVQTEIIERPPPPPRPPVPIEVPDDAVIEDEMMDMDAFLDMDDSMAEAPAPPPPPEEEEEDDQEVFVIVENMPELIGGMAALQQHVEYPEMARRAGIEGRVVVQFIIDKEGYVRDPQVVRSLGGGLDEAAIEAVKQVRFTPGMQRGRPVRVKYTIPVQFRLAQAD
jgi:protein TonB